MSPESTTDTTATADGATILRARRRQVLATTALLWSGFSVIAWALHWKFWQLFAKEEVPAFSRAVFSVSPLILSAAMLAGLGLWGRLHLRLQSSEWRRGIGIVSLALWCVVAGLLCLAFFAPLAGLVTNLGGL